MCCISLYTFALLQPDLEDGRDYGPSPFMGAAGTGAASARTFSGGRSGAASGLSTPRSNNNRSPSGALSRLFTRLFSSSRESSAAVEVGPEGAIGAANGIGRGSPAGEEEGDGLGDLGSPAASASAIFAHRSFSTEVPWSDWEIDPAEIELLKRPDGSTWELGSGGFGRVYKALRNGAQVVAVKVIPVSQPCCMLVIGQSIINQLLPVHHETYTSPLLSRSSALIPELAPHLRLRPLVRPLCRPAARRGRRRCWRPARRSPSCGPAGTLT